MKSPINALIIGGGFSGMSAGIQLRKLGAQVTLVEIDPQWSSYGAGISIGGATLRALRTVGILDDFIKEAYCHDGVDLYTPTGHLIGQLPTPRLAGPDIPGGGGIMRPVLAAILARHARAAGVEVRLGCSFASISQDAGSVQVEFTDGHSERYDLVIGADGLYSKVRETLFPAAPKPRYTGQGVWRAVLPRPAETVRTSMWLGPKVKVGVNPVSQSEMYMFVTEDRPTQERIDPARWPAMLADLLAPFPAPALQAIRAQLSADSRIVFRPLESLLMPQPWALGRVVLIGDTVHATTPHMAAGAGIGVEDAIVLAEELERADVIAAALEKFQARRWERCRMVVENSGRLGDIEIAGGDKDEHARVMRETAIVLAAPI